MIIGPSKSEKIKLERICFLKRDFSSWKMGRGEDATDVIPAGSAMCDLAATPMTVCLVKKRREKPAGTK